MSLNLIESMIFIIYIYTSKSLTLSIIYASISSCNIPYFCFDLHNFNRENTCSIDADDGTHKAIRATGLPQDLDALNLGTSCCCLKYNLMIRMC